MSEHSIDAAWSRDGTVLVYSGADVGTTFPLKAVTPDGKAASLPTLTLTRGARHVAFLNGGLRLALLRVMTSPRDLEFDNDIPRLIAQRSAIRTTSKSCLHPTAGARRSLRLCRGEGRPTSRIWWVRVL